MSAMVHDDHDEIEIYIGDCVFTAHCKCGRFLANLTPDKSWDEFALKHEQHATETST